MQTVFPWRQDPPCGDIIANIKLSQPERLRYGSLLIPPYLDRMGREMSQHTRRTCLASHHGERQLPCQNCARTAAYRQSLRYGLKSAWKIFILPLRHGLASGSK